MIIISAPCDLSYFLRPQLQFLRNFRGSCVDSSRFRRFEQHCRSKKRCVVVCDSLRSHSLGGPEASFRGEIPASNDCHFYFFWEHFFGAKLKTLGCQRAARFIS